MIVSFFDYVDGLVVTYKNSLGLCLTDRTNGCTSFLHGHREVIVPFEEDSLLSVCFSESLEGRCEDRVYISEGGVLHITPDAAKVFSYGLKLDES